MPNEQHTDFNPSTSNTPLYATQDGGYATKLNGEYVWHSEIPDFVNAQPGDPLPEDWSVVSVNMAAHQVEEYDEYCLHCKEPHSMCICEGDGIPLEY